MVVDPNDPAFANPTKPIGPFYTLEKGEELRAQGYTIIEDSGRGYRRVVPSPQPAALAEIYAIRTLVNSGALVICAGGGGVPVVRDAEGLLHGVEAVIDKDLGASLLAQKLDADRLLILTDVEHVAVNFRKPDQRNLDTVSGGGDEAVCSRRPLRRGQHGPQSARRRRLRRVGRHRGHNHPTTLRPVRHRGQDGHAHRRRQRHGKRAVR